MADHPDVKIASSPGVGVFVKSRTTPGAFWLVSDGCTCPAKGPCWHIAQVLEHVRKVEAAKYPPLSVGAKADPSMFVD
jgi:hypothetical protein